MFPLDVFNKNPDAIITENDEQECFIKSLTAAGADFLKTLFPDYIAGNVVCMNLDPDDFFEAVPDGMLIQIVHGDTPTLN